MKKTGQSVFMVVLLFLFVQSGFAQLGNIDVLIEAGVADANLLMQAYLEPFGKGFGADLNNGWFATAKTHKFLGFDLSISGSAAIAPTDAETFDVTTLGLQHLRLTNPADSPLSPTVIGEDQPGPVMDIILRHPLTNQIETVGQIQMPQGIENNYVPSAVVQGSVGLFLNTDLIIRYLPEIEFKNDLGKLRMFGIGAKHDLKQWIPGAGSLPIDLAVMFGVTQLQAESDLAVPVPQDLNAPPNSNYDDQQVELKASSFTLNVIASKQFAILTLFGSIGVESSTVDLKLKGTYPIRVLEPTTGFEIVQDFVDPVDLSFDGPRSFRANVGAQIRLVFLSLYASYTISEYPVLTGGLSFTIR